MTNGPADEPPQGTPGRRALGAMESAVRRARESSSGAPPAPPRREPRPRPADQAPGPGRPSDRWLITSVAVVAVLVVVGAIALGVSLGSSPHVAAPPSSTAASTPTTPAGRPAGRGAATPSHSTSTSTSTSTTATTTTTLPSTPGAAPVISSLTPSSGTAGQGIQVAGANFMSSNGQIVATFNGQVAPTSCPAQDTCSVTVPPPTPGSQSAQVTITTASGTSNAVTFTYG